MSDARRADELTNYTATELVALIRERAVSPVEITRACLERIALLDNQINAFFTVTADRALVEAVEAEQAVAEGGTLGALHGLPLAIKDLTDTAGVRTTYGSRAFADYEPAVNAELVDRIFRAGGIMLGKTATPEFGLNATTEDSPFPPTSNPWDLSRSAGGSSGGSGAALAARMCPLAQGTDGGGSIRIPSAACGVVGLKPARARVPSAPLTGVAWAGFATSGPMARSVADVALLLDVLAGPAVGDPFPIPLPAQSFASAVGAAMQPLRIGWTTSSPEGPVAPDVARAIERTARTLADLGHELEEAAPDTSGLWDTFQTVVRAHTAARPLPNPDLLGENAWAIYDAGQRLSAVDYLRAEQEVYQACRRILYWFVDYDLLLCPTLPRTAAPLGELTGPTPEEIWDKLRRYIAFTYWVNVTGQPAISLPLAVGDDGLPIGVQLVGRQLDERTLLTVAGQLEQALPWADRQPDIVPAPREW